MIKVKSSGRKILLSIHLLFVGVWLGAAVSLVLSHNLAGPENIGGGVSQAYLVFRFIDDYVIIPAAIGCLFSGLLISLFTHWGFFKHRWVGIKWFLTLLNILFGTFFLGPWLNTAHEISTRLDGNSWTNSDFLYNRDMNNLYGVPQVLCLMFMFVLSAYKPKLKKTTRSNNEEKSPTS